MKLTIDDAVEYATGACYAFATKVLTEFGKGGDGVVEIRFKNGKPQGVFVRALRENEPTNKPREIAGWRMTPQDLVESHQDA
jgi:hypothetical protein